MKWEIEGELYIELTEYDMYEIPEAYVITKDINRDNVIYKDKAWALLPYTCGRFNEDHNQLAIPGKSITEWIQESVNIKESVLETNWKNKSGSFQPETKKVRITIEEIE